MPLRAEEQDSQIVLTAEELYTSSQPEPNAVRKEHEDLEVDQKHDGDQNQDFYEPEGREHRQIQTLAAMQAPGREETLHGLQDSIESRVEETHGGMEFDTQATIGPIPCSSFKDQPNAEHSTPQPSPPRPVHPVNTPVRLFSRSAIEEDAPLDAGFAFAAAGVPKQNQFFQVHKAPPKSSNPAGPSPQAQAYSQQNTRSRHSSDSNSTKERKQAHAQYNARRLSLVQTAPRETCETPLSTEGRASQHHAQRTRPQVHTSDSAGPAVQQHRSASIQDDVAHTPDTQSQQCNNTSKAATGSCVNSTPGILAELPSTKMAPPQVPAVKPTTAGFSGPQLPFIQAVHRELGPENKDSCSTLDIPIGSIPRIQPNSFRPSMQPLDNNRRQQRQRAPAGRKREKSNGKVRPAAKSKFARFPFPEEQGHHNQPLGTKQPITDHSTNPGVHLEQFSGTRSNSSRTRTPDPISSDATALPHSASLPERHSNCENVFQTHNAAPLGKHNTTLVPVDERQPSDGGLSHGMNASDQHRSESDHRTQLGAGFNSGSNTAAEVVSGAVPISSSTPGQGNRIDQIDTLKIEDQNSNTREMSEDDNDQTPVEQNLPIDAAMELCSKQPGTMPHHEVLNGPQPDQPFTGDISRALSPGQYDISSRPPSRQSNQGRSMTRPFQDKDQNLAAGSRSQMHRASDNAKIGKPADTSSIGVFDRAQLVAFVEQFDLSAKNYEDQGILLEEKYRELEESKESEQAAINENTPLKAAKETLSKENLELKQKLQKLAQLRDKYRKHANDIVESNHELKGDYIALCKKFEAWPGKSRAQFQELKSGIASAASAFDKLAKFQPEDIKKRIADLARDVESSRGELSNLLRTNSDIVKKNSLLAAEVQDLKEEKKCLNDRVFSLEDLYKRATSENKSAHLKAENERLEGERGVLQAKLSKIQEQCSEALVSNTELENSVKCLEKNETSLEGDMNRCMINLQCKTRLAEKLASELKELKEKIPGEESSMAKNSHDELLEALKQIPENVANKLGEETERLAGIIAVETETQAKVDQVTSLVNALKKHKPEPAESLVKLLQQLSVRLDNIPKPVEREILSQPDPTLRLLEELKANLGQLRTEKDGEARLSITIAELRQGNTKLGSEKKDLESELRDSSKKVEQATGKLNQAMGQLSTCENELKDTKKKLKSAEALRTGNSTLKTKVKELEDQITTQNGELEKSKQELSKVQELSKSTGQELSKLQESSRTAKQEYSKLQESSKSTEQELSKLQESSRTAKQGHSKLQEASKSDKQELSQLQESSKSDKQELSQLQEASKSDKQELSQLRESSKSDKQELSQLQEASKSDKQELSKLRESSKSAEKVSQQLADTLVRINNFKEEKDKYIAIKHQENFVQCQDLTQKAEGARTILKMKLDSEIKILRQNNTKLESKLNSVKKELKKLQTLDAYKEAFGAKIAQLEGSKNQDSSLNASDKTSLELEATREEIRNLRELLESIKTETTRNIESSDRELKDMRTALHWLSSLQVEGHNSRYQEDTDYRQGPLTKHLTTSTKTAERQMGPPTLQPSKSVQNVQPGSSSMLRGTRPTRANGMTSKSTSLETPESALRAATNKAGPGFTLPAHTSTGFGTPQDDIGANWSPPRQFESDSSHLVGSNAKPLLRAAERKRIQPVDQDKVHMNPYSNWEHPRQYGSHAATLGTPNAGRSSYAAPASGCSNSSLTEYDSVVEELPNVNSRTELQQEYEKARGSKHRRDESIVPSRYPATDGLPASRAVAFAPQSCAEAAEDWYRLPDEQDEPPTKRVKTQAKNALSASEESNRRRISKPGKSALKKSNVLGTEIITTTSSRTRSRTFELTTDSPKLPPAENKTQQRRTDPGVQAFKGVAVGRRGGSINPAARQAAKPSLIQPETPAVARPVGLRSPPVKVGRRGRTSSALKPVVPPPPAMGRKQVKLPTVIADSQDGMY